MDARASATLKFGRKKMNKCIICGKPKKTDSFCETCANIIAVCYTGYKPKQLMALYSHILGVKVIQEITDSTYNALKTNYETQRIKKD